MRTIKFRAWDGKTMHFFSLFSTDGTYIIDTGVVIPSEAPVMQFTGLHSKSGVEIYEGDIVVLDGFDTPEKVPALEYAVTGVIGAAANYKDNAVEVIGNVWENPELLK